MGPQALQVLSDIAFMARGLTACTGEWDLHTVCCFESRFWAVIPGGAKVGKEDRPLALPMAVLSTGVLLGTE
jgi:hypothetical protein